MGRKTLLEGLDLRSIMQTFQYSRITTYYFLKNLIVITIVKIQIL